MTPVGGRSPLPSSCNPASGRSAASVRLTGGMPGLPAMATTTLAPTRTAPEGISMGCVIAA